MSISKNKLFKKLAIIYTENLMKHHTIEQYNQSVLAMYNLSMKAAVSLPSNQTLLDSLNETVNWYTIPLAISMMKLDSVSGSYQGYEFALIYKNADLDTIPAIKPDHLDMLAGLNFILANLSHNIYYASEILKFINNYELAPRGSDSPLLENPHPAYLNFLMTVDRPITSLQTMSTSISPYTASESIIVKEVSEVLLPIMFSSYKTKCRLYANAIDTRADVITEFSSYYSATNTGTPMAPVYLYSPGMSRMASKLSEFLVVTNTSAININPSKTLEVIEASILEHLPTVLDDVVGALNPDLIDNDIMGGEIVTKFMRVLVDYGIDNLLHNSDGSIVIQSTINEPSVTELISEHDKNLRSIEAVAITKAQIPLDFINSRPVLYSEYARSLADFDLYLGESFQEEVIEARDTMTVDLASWKTALELTELTIEAKLGDHLLKIINQVIYKYINIAIQSILYKELHQLDNLNELSGALPSVNKDYFDYNTYIASRAKQGSIVVNNQGILDILSTLNSRIPGVSVSQNYKRIVDFIRMQINVDIVENSFLASLVDSYKVAILSSAFDTIDDAFQIETLSIGATVLTPTRYYTHIKSIDQTVLNLKRFYTESTIASKYHGVLNRYRVST